MLPLKTPRNAFLLVIFLLVISCVLYCYNEYSKTSNLRASLKAYKSLIKDNQLDSAQVILQKVLYESTTFLKTPNAYQAKAYHSLGYLAHKKGYYENALIHYDKALKLRKIVLHSRHEDIAATHNNIGLIYQERGEYEKALAHIHKALNIGEASFFKNKKKLANNCNNIANILQRQGKHAETLDYYQKALAIRIALKDPFAISTSHLNIGTHYHHIGQYEKALQAYETALKMRKKIVEPQAIDLAIIYNNIGAIYEAQKDLKKAQKHYQNVLNIRTAACADSHPNIVSPYNGLARIYIQKMEADSALYFCNKAMIANLKNKEDKNFIHQNATKIKVFNKKNFLSSFQLYAKALKIKYQQKQNITYLKSALHIHQISDTLIDNINRSYVYDSDKFSFQEAKSYYLQAFNCSQLLYEKTNAKTYLKQAFSFLEKGKSSVLLQSILANKALKFGNVPDHLIQQEYNFKNQIANYENKLQKTTKDRVLWQDSLLNVRIQNDQLIKYLENNYPHYYNIKYNTKIVDITRIQQLLKSKNLLVEYAIDRAKDSIYIFTISKQNANIISAKWHKNTDDNIAALRNLLVGKSDELMQEKGHQQFINLASQLYQQLLAPIQSQLENMEQLIFIPAEKLNALPFELLLERADKRPFKDLDYLIKKHQISYHYSATLFEESQKKHTTTYTNDFLAFAPIHFNSQIHPDLPHSEIEVDAIEQLYEANGLHKTDVFKNDKANEGLFKQLTAAKNKSYKIIHIASHSKANTYQPKQSYICFAPAIDSEDDLLYFSEVYNMQLKTELMVLSSCESGYGKLVNGEGLLGINRSFIYAGASNILFSLWTVNDQETSTFMKDFYTPIVAHQQSYSKALRRAKLKAISKGKLPHIWSAFVLMGE